MQWNNSLSVSTDDLIATFNQGDVKFHSSQIKIAIDNNSIFSIEGLIANNAKECEEVKIERENTDDIILPSNRTW